MKNIFGENHGLDEKSMDFLIRAIERSNLSGFDYIEFKLALDNLSKMNLDEASAYKAAFATAITLGMTKEKLAESARYYRGVIVKEKEQFDTASQKQQDQRIAAKLQQVADLKKAVEDNQLKIKQLQEEIEKSNTQVREIDFEIEGAVTKINEAKSKFSLAHQSVLNLMDKDLENINTYL